MSLSYSGRGAAAPTVRACAAALCAIFGLLSAVPASGQQGGTIQGTVLSRESGEPLPGAAVTVEGTGHGVLTDARGRFLIPSVPAGEHAVAARRVGRDAQTVGVSVPAGGTVSIEIRLAEAAVLLPGLVVSATREARRLSETAAAVGVISAQELRDARPTHPADVMQRIPGVWMGATGGEGHMTAIRMPKTTDPVYLFLEDGIPTRSTGFFNHNALYEVNLPQAERVEVLKGPATALYGSDAIGGVINVETRRASLDPTAEAYAEGGGHGWGRLLLSASDTWGDDGLRADLNLTRTDGWRDGTGYDRVSGTLRWDRSLAGGTLKTVLTGSRIEQQTAGSSSLLRDDYLDRPTVNYTPISMRDVRAVRFSTAFERATTHGLFSVTPYLRWNDMEILPNWSLTYDPTLYTTGHASAGVLARARYDLDPLRTRVIAGVDVDYSPGGREEYRIDAVRQGQVFTDFTRGDLLYDYEVRFRSFSPYLQAEANPVERLHLMAGVRYDRMGYAYDSRLEPLQTGRWRRPADAEVSYDHLSPKLGATYEVGRALHLYANYTHGFRAPSEGQLFRQGSAENTIDLKPVVAHSVEGGVRGELSGRLGYSLGAYRMVVENDILTYIQPSGLRETQNAGETLHRGVEAAVGVEVAEGVRADLSYAWSRHTYREWSPAAGVEYAGNEQESAPNVLASARLAYQPEFLPRSRVALEWSRVGRYWMDAENTHRYPGHSLLTLSASAPVTRDLELIGRVANLTSERYAETASYTQARGAEFAPGLPRTLYLGVQYRWQGYAR